MVFLLVALQPALAADRTWYLDADGDGYGVRAHYTVADEADPPAGYTLFPDDCDDADAAIHPSATESCDGVDEDCDGAVDSSAVCGVEVWQWNGHGYLLVTDRLTWERADAACRALGYQLTTIASEAEDAALDVAVDRLSTGKWWTGFNDIDAEGQWVWADGSDGLYTNWYPGEPNNGLGGGEEDCAPLNRFQPDRGWNDEPCSDTDAYVCESGVVRTMYLDADGDGHGDPSEPAYTASDAVEGYAADADDCDDGAASVHPGAAETWYDGVDGDCDGHSDFDADFDGYDAATSGGDDCDDRASTVHPGAADTWYDGLDADCSGSDYDQDGDGADHDGYGGDDCDDTDPAVGPDATEVPGNGVDEDCDGLDAVVADTGATDTGTPDTDTTPEAPEADPEDLDAKGSCGCAAAPGAGALLPAVLLAALLPRRRRAPAVKRPRP